MPDPLELELSSHELFVCPPGTPAIGPAVRVELPASICAESELPVCVVLARTVYLEENGNPLKLVFLREESRPLNDVFGFGPLHVSRNWLEEGDAQRRDGARYFAPPGADYCLELNGNTTGMIHWPGGSDPRESKFFWAKKDVRASFWNLNAAKFDSLCNHMIEDPSSDFNFCLRWRGLSPEEKNALVLHCEVGDWNVMRHLFTCVLRLKMHFFEPSAKARTTGERWNFIEEIRSFMANEAQMYAGRWQEVLFEVFQPEFKRRERCFAIWNTLRSSPVRTVSCSPPTMHEVMEAKLELREFLRPYKSAAAIEALLTP